MPHDLAGKYGFEHLSHIGSGEYRENFEFQLLQQFWVARKVYQRLGDKTLKARILIILNSFFHCTEMKFILGVFDSFYFYPRRPLSWTKFPARFP